VLNLDFPNNVKFYNRIKRTRKVITYGLNKKSEIRGKDAKFDGKETTFMVERNGKNLGQVKLGVPGIQNVMNALGVLAIGFELGEDFATMSQILRLFGGARRRFQLIGEYKDIMIVDDYAHHPTEISYTLASARGGWPKRRIIVVFQPHRYSRSLFLKEEFGKCFSDADMVISTEIYSAGEDPIPGINGESMSKEIMKHHKNVVFIPRKEKISEFLAKEAKPGDIIITAGAGDILNVGKELLGRLKNLEKK
jgi:UDP-N-acetylmuramate--alanine ligase